MICVRLCSRQGAIYGLLLTALLALGLTACAPTGVDVPPPLIITVVVTAGPNAGSAEATPLTETNATPVATSAYPPPTQNNVAAVYQPFEHGFMIYLGDRQTVWIFIRSIFSSAGTPTPTQDFGVWLAFPDTFKEGDPEIDPTLVAPTGLLQPKRGFGKVWREHLDVQTALGWALDYERPYTALTTDYSLGTFDANGNYTPHSLIHTVTTVKDELIHIDEAAHTWSKP